MSKTFTPVQIEILLHCYYCATPVPRHDAPAIAKALRLFMHYDFIRPGDAPGVYRTTTKGDEFVDRLMVAAYSIAKRVNKGVDVVKPTLSDSATRMMHDFEAYTAADKLKDAIAADFAAVRPYASGGFVRDFIGYGAPNWARGPVPLKFTVLPNRRYSASIKVDHDTGELIKDFIAAAYEGNAPKTAELREWMTPEWVNRFKRWRDYFARAGMKGAFHRRLMDMLFAKTDKLRDRPMCAAVSVNVRAIGPKPTYAQLRRAILDTRVTK